MKNWIKKQMEFIVSQFDQAMEKHHPESKRYLKDPKKFLKRICEEANYLDAIKIIDWNRYCKNNVTILDLGGGIGWLSAYLSRIDKVDKILFLDSCKFFINDMLPKVFKLMNGKINKIIPIKGFFSPLILEDNLLDMVVVSSSLHHADNIESVLKEIKRVLKKGGLLFILNEIPYSYPQYLILTLRILIKILKDIIFLQYKQASRSLSSAGILTDPHLGDRAYPFWYWKKVIKRSGFSIQELIDTRLSTLKGRKGPHLVHFICRQR